MGRFQQVKLKMELRELLEMLKDDEIFFLERVRAVPDGT